MTSVMTTKKHVKQNENVVKQQKI